MRSPAICADNDDLLKENGAWARKGAMKLATAAIWLDRWPRTSFADGYITPESFNAPDAELRDLDSKVTFLARRRFGKRHYDRDVLAETIGVGLNQPFDRPGLSGGARAQHGSPIPVFWGASGFEALLAFELPVKVDHPPSQAPIAQSSDGSLAIYADALAEIWPGFRESGASPQILMDTTLGGEPFGRPRTGPFGPPTRLTTARSAQDRRTSPAYWRDGWVVVDPQIKGRVRFQLQLVAHEETSAPAFRGLRIGNRTIAATSSFISPPKSGFTLVDYHSRRAFSVNRYIFGEISNE